MSIKVMNFVWEHSRQKGAALLALLAIADSANDDGFCWLALPKIAKKARQDAPNTRTYIQKIERDGEVIVYERRNEEDPTQQHSNLYKVVMPGTSEETPPDLRGKLKRRQPKPVPPRKIKGGGNFTPTPLIELPPPPSQNYGADPLSNPSSIPDQEKKKDSSPNGGAGDPAPEDPPKERTPEQAARDALNAAVETMFGAEGMSYALQSKWANFLTGNTPEFTTPKKKGEKPTSNGEWFEHQILPGMDVDEISAFGSWYRSTSPGIRLPQACHKVNMAVALFRGDPTHDRHVERARLNREALEDLAARGGEHEDPEPEEDAPPMSEEQREEVQARLNALQAKMGGGK